MQTNGQLKAPAVLTRIRASGSHCTGGWVGPRACLDPIIALDRNRTPIIQPVP